MPKDTKPKTTGPRRPRHEFRTRHIPVKMTQHKAEDSLFVITDAVYEIDGTALNALLAKLGVSQRELSEACGYRGVSRISHIIRGDNGSGKSKIKHGPLSRMIEYLNAHGATVSMYDIDIST